ncbi:MAG: hypothetical protein IPJ33_00735 [Gammaproteobacteria bacterium]|nr:hypothetical protein [Gammaproteobacteria bacterium]
MTLDLWTVGCADTRLSAFALSVDKPWKTLRVCHRLPTGRRLSTSSTTQQQFAAENRNTKSIATIDSLDGTPDTSAPSRRPPQKHPDPDSEKMQVLAKHLSQTGSRDATDDYPQSRAEIQMLCVYVDTLGRQAPRGQSWKSW